MSLGRRPFGTFPCGEVQRRPPLAPPESGLLAHTRSVAHARSPRASRSNSFRNEFRPKGPERVLDRFSERSRPASASSRRTPPVNDDAGAGDIPSVAGRQVVQHRRRHPFRVPAGSDGLLRRRRQLHRTDIRAALVATDSRAHPAPPDIAYEAWYTAGGESSLIAQGNQGIDPRRAAGRQIAGEERHADQRERHRRVDGRIDWLHVEEQRRHGPAKECGANQA